MFSEGQSRVTHGRMLCSSCCDSGCPVPQLQLPQPCNTSYDLRPLELNCFSTSWHWDGIVEDSWNCSTWTLSTLCIIVLLHTHLFLCTSTMQPACQQCRVQREHTHKEMGLFPCPCLSKEPHICNFTYSSKIASLTYLRHSLPLLFYMSGFLFPHGAPDQETQHAENKLLSFPFYSRIFPKPLNQKSPGSGNEQVIWANVEST